MNHTKQPSTSHLNSRKILTARRSYNAVPDIKSPLVTWTQLITIVEADIMRERRAKFKKTAAHQWMNIAHDILEDTDPLMEDVRVGTGPSAL